MVEDKTKKLVSGLQLLWLQLLQHRLAVLLMIVCLVQLVLARYARTPDLVKY